MPSFAQHIIRKATFEVGADANLALSSNDALRLQQEAMHWANEFLLPELERLFSTLPEQEESIVIDRLDFEINAGNLTDWRERSREKFNAEIVPSLIRKVMDKIKESDLILHQATRGGQNPSGHAFFEKLAYFLEQGVLPWNWIVTSPSDLENQFSLWLETPSPPKFRHHFAVLLGDVKAQHRFLKAFPPLLVQKALAKIFNLPTYFWMDWQDDLRSLHIAFNSQYSKDFHSAMGTKGFRGYAFMDSFPSPLFLPRLLVASLAENLKSSHSDWEKNSLESFFISLEKDPGINLNILRTVQFQSQGFTQIRESILKRKDFNRGLGLGGEVRAQAENRAGSGSASLTSIGEDKQQFENKEDVENASLRKSISADLGRVQESVFIQNAGLILVAPFLTRLFERLAMVEQDILMEPALALTLLHYLSTGSDSPSEFQLALPKVLVGLELDTALDFPLSLSSAMKMEVESLLASAINHWSVLGNTSVTGLRDSFLNRSGKLSRNSKEEWLLQVEQKSFDMLIQQLPWSINLIRLPWMPKVLRTEWIE